MINALVHSMRASSTTNGRAPPCSPPPDTADEVDVWTRKHSSTLEMFHEISCLERGAECQVPRLRWDSLLHCQRAGQGTHMHAMVKGVVSYLQLSAADVGTRCGATVCWCKNRREVITLDFAKK